MKDPSGQKRRSRTKKGKGKKRRFEELNLDAAGIDIGSGSHFVAVPEDRDEQSVREFKSFTNDLYRLADWLKSCGVTTVAMESTGVYWIPLYEILEERGFEVLLVNARHVKNVPGRKTDVVDCQWLQQLHTYGLLRGSFRPEQDITPMRSYFRHRERLVEYAASHIQHMQKALVQMNIQLHKVVSDITGATGMAILRAIVSGNYNPQTLSQHRDARCRASKKEIAEALTGNYRPEHVFALTQALELYDLYQEKIRECDAKIEAELRNLESKNPGDGPSLPTGGTKQRIQKNDLRFKIRDPLYAVTGVDLSQIDGITPSGALRIISEIGLDMNRWPTAKNFTSWLTLAPNNKISGGKLLGSKTQSSANRVAKYLRLVAVNVGRTSTALGAFYRRLGARIGKAKAVTATARKLAVIIYTLLKKGTGYSDPGADAYDARHRGRVLSNLRKRAGNLGFDLVEREQVADAHV